MDIAIADFIFSNGPPISLVQCTKCNKLIQSTRHIPPNNPFALLDIVDCTSETAKGGKKDAKYIAWLLKPIIS
jgi:hypothetical protein